MKLADAFFSVYPELLQEFNPNAYRKVTFLVDSSYNGIAATNDNHITYSTMYLRRFPHDIDMVTHYLMHVVQAYTNGCTGVG